MRYMSSYVKWETILFEANPIANFSLYNNFEKGLMNGKNHLQAWYFSFKPQLRMYTENSLPVKTPSYRIFPATQHMFRLQPPNDSVQRFWGFAFESGHYSNGQSGCAFSEMYEDGTKESNRNYIYAD